MSRNDGKTTARSGGLPFGLKLRLFVRSLSLQASWNHERMQNLGLLTVMLPWVRTQRRNLNQDRVFCRRYYEFFNTNPYLANFVIGGLVRLEDDRIQGQELAPGTTTMFRDSLGRAFASLGDQLFWLGIRPAMAMAICLLGLHGQMLAVIVLVGIFAMGQLVLRWRSLDRGYDLGFDLVDLLQHRHWHRWIAIAKRLGMLLTGIMAGTYLSMLSRPGMLVHDGKLWFGVLAGLGLPIVLRRRLPGEVLILAGSVLAVLLAFAVLLSGS